MGAVAVVPESPVEGRSVRVLRPVAAVAELLSAQNDAREFVMQVLKEGGDYGKIPGVERPTLLKPGAEKVTLAFGCAAVPKIVEREVDHDRTVRWVKRKARWETVNGRRQKTGEDVTEGDSLGLYRYVVEVQIIDQHGDIRGSGLGSCSSVEAKYVDRPRESENTILKMATKRAHVAAVLATFGLSETFTQDVEEMPHVQEAAAERPAASRATSNGNGASHGNSAAFVMPFGSSKGTPLGEMDTEDLSGAIKWAESKGKFEEFQKVGKAELARRASEAADLLREESVLETVPLGEPPMDGDDDLPF